MIDDLRLTIDDSRGECTTPIVTSKRPIVNRRSLFVIRHSSFSLLGLVFLTLLRAQEPATSGSMPPHWRPNHPPQGQTLAGESVCAPCHASKITALHAAPMGRASETAAECQVLRSHPNLTFQNGRYRYSIVREGDWSIYSVSDGQASLSEPILYAFGQGKAGQTYVLFHGGTYRESRVSFYNETQGLDLTLGAARSVPDTLDEALGRIMSRDEVLDCFGCHTTGAVSGSELSLDKLETGLKCEACHASGEKHVAAMKSGDTTRMLIFNPAALSGDQLSQDFCGACHRSAGTVFSMPMRAGINSVRFQPYRIFNSKCYSDDRRIQCTACHNPHARLERDSSFYDSKCLTCHRTGQGRTARSTAPALGDSAGAASAPACKVGAKKCVDCHMARTEIPGSHFKFTDHWIRIVKPGDSIPF